MWKSNIYLQEKGGILADEANVMQERRDVMKQTR